MRRGQPKRQPSWPSIVWPSAFSFRRPASHLAPSGCRSHLKTLPLPHPPRPLRTLPCRSTHTAPLQLSRNRCSQSSVSRQLCNAGSLGGACVCLSAALPPMGFGRMGTLLSSTCCQLLEKPQPQDLALSAPRKWTGNLDACFPHHWGYPQAPSQLPPACPVLSSPAGPALPAPSSMPQAALAVRCVAPRGPALGIPLPQLPPSSHQRYQRWLRQGRWGHGRTYRNEPAPPPQVTRGEWPFPHRPDVSRPPPNSGDLY